MVSVLVRDPTGQLTLVAKGAPETILDRCVAVPTATDKALEAEFAAGNRVVAVATLRVPNWSSTAATCGIAVRWCGARKRDAAS